MNAANLPGPPPEGSYLLFQACGGRTVTNAGPHVWSYNPFLGVNVCGYCGICDCEEHNLDIVPPAPMLKIDTPAAPGGLKADFINEGEDRPDTHYLDSLLDEEPEDGSKDWTDWKEEYEKVLLENAKMRESVESMMEEVRVLSAQFRQENSRLRRVLETLDAEDDVSPRQRIQDYYGGAELAHRDSTEDFLDWLQNSLVPSPGVEEETYCLLCNKTSHWPRDCEGRRF